MPKSPEMPKQQITIPVFVPHRGCPHRCIFCNQHRSAGDETSDPVKIASLVEKYLEEKKDSVSLVEIAFFGGSFTGIAAARQEEFLAAAHSLKECGRVHGIRLSARPDYIDHDRLSLLLKYGVDTVELGVQSFNNIVLERANRGHDARASVKAFHLLREMGFKCVIQLMPGLPGGSHEEAMNSAGQAAALKPDAVRIYPTVVLKDTRLAEMYLGNTYYPLTMEGALDICASMYDLFHERDIPVIRTGLHPLARENENAIIAGPYHPAFGYMVKSRVRRREMERLAQKSMAEGRNEIIIPLRNREEYIGYQRENLSYIKEIFPGVEILFETEKNK